MYIRKTITGKAPSLDLKWTENSGSRSGHNLALQKLKGRAVRAKGCMRNYLRYGNFEVDIGKLRSNRC